MPGTQDVLGLGRFCDHADGAGSNPRLLAHPLGEPSLVTGADWNFCIGRRAARRHVDQVHAYVFQASRQLNGFVRIPAVFDPVSGRDTYEQWQFFGPNGAYRLGDLQGQANAIFKRAAILIATLIAQRRQELMQQIAVSGVNLDHFETRRQRALRRVDERLNHLLDLVLIQLYWRRVFGVECDRRRPDWCPATLT